MRPFIILLFTILTLNSYLSAQTEKRNTLIDEMKTHADIFINYSSYEELLNSFDAMNELDFELKKEKCLQKLENLDMNSITGAELRDIGFLLYASNFKKEAKSVFYMGAEKGDPYCINYALVDIVVEKQNPEVVVEIIELMPENPTVPLIYNIALLLYHIKDKKLKKLGNTVADHFFEYTDALDLPLDNYNPEEFIEYRTNPTFRKINGVWKRASQNSKVEDNLLQFYPR